VTVGGRLNSTILYSHCSYY